MKNNYLLCITGAYHSSGGIAAVNRLVIRSLLEDGYRLTVCALNEAEKPASGLPSELTYQGFSGSKRRFARKLWGEISRIKPTLVYVDHANLAAAVAPLALGRGQRYLVWLHGIEVFPPKPNIEGKIGLHWARQCLCSSEYTRLQVRQRYPDLSLRTCEPALDPENYGASLPEEPALLRDRACLENICGEMQELGERAILHVGRMAASERYKGQDTLITAFPRIAVKFSEAQLVLAGDGDDRPYLLSLARTLPHDLQKRIFMPGSVDKDVLSKLYGLCYLFAMPSSGEGFGIVYLEAMLHARPCLGGATDAAPYIIQDGVTGVLVKNPRSAEEAAEKICWLMERPEIARQMGLAGYARVGSNYLFPHFKKRFLEAIAG